MILLAAVSTIQAPHGKWMGELAIQNAAWPMTLHVDPSGNASIDLPQMLYFDQPAKSRMAEGKLIVELPFRFGEVALDRQSGKLTGKAEVAGRTMTVSLRGESGKPKWTSRDVEFRSGDLTLKGTIFAPNTPGPHPAAVQIHGAGPRGRSSWAYVGAAKHFASQGVAILAYDKRPYESVYPDLKELTADAEAAFRFLVTQPEVDKSRTGLTGGSQAGWIISELAASVKPAWILGTSLPTNSPGENEHWVQMKTAETAGKATPEELLRLDTYLRLFFYSCRTGKSFEDLVEMGQALPDAEWTKTVEIPTERAHFGWWKPNMDFTFGRTWNGVSVPMLALYGEKDILVDPYGDPARLRVRVPTATIQTLPEADHRLEIPGGMINGQWRWPQMAPGYFQAVSKFLREKVDAKPVKN